MPEGIDISVFSLYCVTCIVGLQSFSFDSTVIRSKIPLGGKQGMGRPVSKFFCVSLIATHEWLSVLESASCDEVRLLIWWTGSVVCPSKGKGSAWLGSHSLILVDLQVKYTASTVTFNISGSQGIELLVLVFLLWGLQLFPYVLHNCSHLFHPSAVKWIPPSWRIILMINPFVSGGSPSCSLFSIFQTICVLCTCVFLKMFFLWDGVWLLWHSRSEFLPLQDFDIAALFKCSKFHF